MTITVGEDAGKRPRWNQPNLSKLAGGNARAVGQEVRASRREEAHGGGC